MRDRGDLDVDAELAPTKCTFDSITFRDPKFEFKEVMAARHIEAMARVFGAGCTSLQIAGNSPERIAALEYFVTRTSGGLTSFDLHDAMVSPEVLLRLCRASPKLTKLQGPMCCTPDATIAAIGVACPYLEDVDISYLASSESAEYSPAETWARHFPRLCSIKLNRGQGLDYKPTRIDGIRATALATNASILDVEACHITREVIEAVVGTPLGDRIETLGKIDCCETNFEPEALLAAARGFPRLTEVCIPEGSTMGGHHFYTQLARAAPQLRDLHIWDDSTTAACVAAACDMRLERLHLHSFYYHGDRHIIDGIIGGQVAETLEELSLHYIAEGEDCELFVRAADVLRVVQGCPKLKRLSWWSTMITSSNPSSNPKRAEPLASS